MLHVWLLLLFLDQIVHLTQPITIFKSFSLALLFTTLGALPPNGILGVAVFTNGSLGDALLIKGS